MTKLPDQIEENDICLESEIFLRRFAWYFGRCLRVGFLGLGIE